MEVPDLYKGLLSCDFTTEDILDVTNYLREQVEDDNGKSLEHFIAPSEHSTTAIISVYQYLVVTKQLNVLIT